MKKLLLTGLLAVMMVAVFAQKPHKVMFYNFENLFDTIRDPEIYDSEFTPEGPKRWNATKYQKKLDNLSRVLFDIAAIDKNYPAVIGVSEIENRTVLEDVIAQPKMAPANYRIVHYDSPDARGVDCAFFYRPDVLKLEGSAPIRFTMKELPNVRTRDIITMWGKIDGEDFYFMVGHWPSRLGGKEASAPRRNRAAEIMRNAADSVLAANPATKIVMMGDFNDDATDDSIVEILGGKGDIKKLEKGDYFNPYVKMLKAGLGTLAYQDSWNIFDNIVVSENLATGSTGSLKLQRAEGSKFWGNIFNASYLFQKEGQYKGYPLRTFVGNNFQGGYSDHLPVYIYIGK